MLFFNLSGPPFVQRTQKGVSYIHGSQQVRRLFGHVVMPDIKKLLGSVMCQVSKRAPKTLFFNFQGQFVAETYFIAALYATIVFGMIMMTEAAEGKAGLATNSIFFLLPFCKKSLFCR